MTNDPVQVCGVCRLRPPLYGGACRLCRANHCPDCQGTGVRESAARGMVLCDHTASAREAVLFTKEHAGTVALIDPETGTWYDLEAPRQRGTLTVSAVNREAGTVTFGAPPSPDLGAAVARGEARARQVVDETMAALYPAGALRTAVYGGGTNRHARRRAAKRGARR